MNPTTPEQMTSETSKVKEVMSKFEEKFAEEEKDQEYYHLVIRGECNRKICDEIELIYIRAGWSKVICSTSSENGERPGLTGLQLYR